METKCAAFWHHTNIRNDNKIFPCCRFKTPVAEFTGDVISILDQDAYKKLREQSSTNIPIAGCEKCYYEESLGKKSMRQQFNEDYDTSTVNLEFLEVGLDNICNLTCDGCWDEFSSSWSKKLYPDVIPIRSSTDIVSLPNTINKLLFLGGEPLMTTRHIKILKMVSNLTELTVVYNTNGTFLLDTTTIELLKQAKSVKFIVSIDGFGELNDKVRSGSKWSDIINFINQITDLGFELQVHTVIHLNNWQGLPEVEEFVKRCHLPWSTNILTYPKHLDVNNLSDKQSFTEIITNSSIPNKEFILKHVNQV